MDIRLICKRIRQWHVSACVLRAVLDDAGCARDMLQGQLRIGDGDMDVNWSRNEALLEALHEAQNRGEMPSEDSC